VPLIALRRKRREGTVLHPAVLNTRSPRGRVRFMLGSNERLTTASSASVATAGGQSNRAVAPTAPGSTPGVWSSAHAGERADSAASIASFGGHAAATGLASALG
jgi:hypothetical protein